MSKQITVRYCLFIFLLVALTATPGYSQQVDSKGDEFIFSFLQNIFDAEACEVYLSAETATDVTIEYPINSPTFTTTVSVLPGDVTVVSIPPEAANSWNYGQTLNNAVRAFSPSGTEFSCVLANLKTNSSDAALALPTDALGTDYIVATFHTQANFNIDGARSEFIVTAVADNTTLTITPRIEMAGTGGVVYPAGIPFNFALNRGESFYGRDTYLSSPASYPGLAGTIVQSDKPVAVVNGNKCTTVPVNPIQSGGCSHLFDMAIPTAYWSQEVRVPDIPPIYSSVVRIFSSQDNTQIRRYPGAPLYLGTFDRGDYVDTGIYNSSNNEISGTNPVQVTQFSLTNLPGPGFNQHSAPSMSTTIPVEQFDNRYTFRTIADGRFGEHWATIIANGRDVGTLTLDGVPVPETKFSSFTGFIGSTNEACLYAAYLPISEGVHQTASARGHWVRVSGVDSIFDAYSYPVGAWFNRAPATDVYDPQASYVINGPTAFFHATDSISEDNNQNLLLDSGEDLNGDGVLNIETGITSVSLAQPTNLSLNAPFFKGGKGSVDFTVSLIDSCIPGSGSVWLRDCSGKLTSIPVQIPAVLCPNNPPMCNINPPGPIIVNPGEMANFTVSASDLNTSDQITLDVSPLPSGATMSPGLPVVGPGSGLSSDFSWLPDTSQGGSYQLIYTVTDDNNATSTCMINIIVNGPPVCGFSPNGPITVDEGDTINFFVFGGDPISTGLITLDVSNLPAGATMNPPLPQTDDGEDGVASQFSWIPAVGQAGFYMVMFSVTDDQGLVSNCTMDITVNSISGNSPPVCSISPPGPFTVNEGDSVNFSISASDPNTGDQITLDVASLPTGASMNPALPLSGAASGISSDFSWIPATGQTGNYTINFTVMDSQNASSSCNVDINVNQVTGDNTAPECQLVNTDFGPPVKIQVLLTDSGSGVAEINILKLSNATLEIPPGSGNFYQNGDVVSISPSLDSLLVEATKVDQSKGSSLALKTIDAQGNATTCDPVYNQLTGEMPKDFALEQNYPNPFNPNTTIRFSIAPGLGYGDYVTIRIYDPTGREVRTLFDEPLSPGNYELKWDGRDNESHRVAGGVYLYRIQTGNFSQTRKMILLK